MLRHTTSHIIRKITLSSPTEAQAIWYLQDWALVLSTRQIRSGTAIIRDRYEKIGGSWKITYYQYRRVLEMVSKLPDDAQLTAHYLGRRNW
jgi:hypothetical protein